MSRSRCYCRRNSIGSGPWTSCATPAKLYHLGIRGKISRSNLADANETRDWRIHCEFAQALIRIARRLYADESLAVDLDNTVYALDSTTIDLCLSLFPWAPFRETKAAIKLHTLLDLRGAIPAFIFISDGKLHDVNVLDILLPEPGAFYVMDRGYLDFERLHALHQTGSFFVTRAKSNFKCKRIYSSPVDRSTGLICDQQVELTVFYSQRGYPERLRRIRYKDPETGKTLVFLTTSAFRRPASALCTRAAGRWSCSSSGSSSTCASSASSEPPRTPSKARCGSPWPPTCSWPSSRSSSISICRCIRCYKS